MGCGVSSRNKQARLILSDEKSRLPGSDDHAFKLLVVGDVAVGKTSFITRFIDRRFHEHPQISIGKDFKEKTIEIDGTRLRVRIFDTAGEETFRTITSTYYRQAFGALILYDVNDRKTFDSLSTWISEIYRYADDHVQCIIVGNKTDLPDNMRQVPESEGENFAAGFDALFMESSAKEDVNVDECFEALARAIIKSVY
eukprot:TRINITY_DN12537_c0_g1_i1.p1 TRINITY_DN12537_c0_g1~~TRINITY_DN12537_c0_g1_i1.p1  ORF type:complete len:198 (-),score=31.45 TRINITY_DN12537_c0_g1_i1:47-640(-)